MKVFNMTSDPEKDMIREEGLDFNGALPLYHQLKNLIHNKITEHVWKLDEMIPSENEMAAAYGVSVGTVKKAISELVKEGVLYRRQGKGTYVAKPDFTRSFIRFFRYGLGESREGEFPSSRVLESSTIIPDIRISDILKLEKGERVIAIKRLRTIHDEPLMLEDLYLPEKTFKGFDEVDISRKLLYPIYNEKYGTPIIWADEFLEPRIADEKTARIFQIEEGAPVIHIERIAYTHGDRPVEFRSSIGRGDRFRYHIVLR